MELHQTLAGLWGKYDLGRRRVKPTILLETAGTFEGDYFLKADAAYWVNPYEALADKASL